MRDAPARTATTRPTPDSRVSRRFPNPVADRDELRTGQSVGPYRFKLSKAIFVAASS
jgi:hypothetical protein